MSYGDPAVTDKELEAFYGKPLSETAIEIGQQRVIDDMELVGEFFAESDDDREPCAYFGPISTGDLTRQILFNKDANDAQIAAAARELRARLLSRYEQLALEAAMRAQG